MRSVSWPLILAILTVLPTAAPARDILVSNTGGDDGFTGQRWEAARDGSGPLRTIGRAISLADVSDRIVLAKTAKPYQESLSLMGSRHSGVARQPFLIVGNGAILDGSAPVPPNTWTYHRDRTFVFRPPLLGHQQLFRDDVPVPQVSLPASATAVPKLEPLHWCLQGGQIYFAVEKDKLPGDYHMSYATRETGITLAHVENVSIVDLVVQGFRIDGINAANSARDIRLVHITARGNGRSGIAVGGACLVGLEGCLLGNNSEAQLLTFPYGETHVDNSSLLPIGGPGWVDRGGKVFQGDKLLHGGQDKIGD